MKRLEKEPFALIGINTDLDLDKMKDMLGKQRITWRNTWEGAVPPGQGALSRAWEINAYPTMVLLDARGVVRARDPENFDQAVDALVAEAKSGANR